MVVRVHILAKFYNINNLKQSANHTASLVIMLEPGNGFFAELEYLWQVIVYCRYLGTTDWTRARLSGSALWQQVCPIFIPFP